MAEEEPIARYRRFERLNELSPRHRESLLALAECALAAELWSDARKNLEFVAAGEGDRPSGRLAQLMARLEEGPQGDAAAARRWLMAAAHADPDPGWQCRRCGTLARSWRANCGHCQAFDSLAWQLATMLCRRCWHPWWMHGHGPFRVLIDHPTAHLFDAL